MTNPRKSQKSVTISIVSHNQLGLILPLLEQLGRMCSGLVDKIIITLNVPEPDLITAHGWGIPTEVVTNPMPKGFGANHNAAFARCKSPWFLVLNPDVRLDTDVLTPLLAFADSNIGLLAPRVLEPGKSVPEPHRDVLTPLEILLRHRSSYTPPEHPAWIAGVFMLFRSAAFRQIAGFDQRFFMYGEDFDICARLDLQGWGLKVHEGTRILHAAQRNSHRSRRHLYWHVTSLLKVWLSGVFWRYLTARRMLERKFH